jgi:hypothetical protein
MHRLAHVIVNAPICHFLPKRGKIGIQNTNKPKQVENNFKIYGFFNFEKNI